MSKAIFKLLCVSNLILFGAAFSNSKCDGTKQITMEKTVGFRPLSPVSLFRHDVPETSASLTGDCITRCRGVPECYGVTVSYSRRQCEGVAYNRSFILKTDNDISFFTKLCMEVHKDCADRWWVIEAIPGYHLFSQTEKVTVILNSTSDNCSEAITSRPPNDPSKFSSAQFVADNWEIDNFAYDGNEITKSDMSKGKCILNAEDKYTEPESFRVANYDTYYKENQCVQDFPSNIDRCSYEEYYNQTLRHADLILRGITKSQCKFACEDESRFVCRGFTTFEELNVQNKTTTAVQSRTSNCALHSEDILTFGSWLLTKKPNAIYYRRVTCLNISVQCSSKKMTLSYKPRGEFRGRFYVAGRGAACGVAGRGRGQVTSLELPLQGPCEINTAYSVSTAEGQFVNKTLVYAMVVVQNNPIIQMQGDRYVRVGCVLGADEAANVTVDTAVSVDNERERQLANLTTEYPEIPPIPATTIINATTVLPRVIMYIVDDDKDGSIDANALQNLETGTVSLGETLELRIESNSLAEAHADIRPYHLVASSQLGDSSVLLLDNRGCPTGQVDFPAFRRSIVNGTVRLGSRFKAFRFPNSHVVKFHVMIRFCDGLCEKLICGGPSSNPDIVPTSTPPTASSTPRPTTVAPITTTSTPVPINKTLSRRRRSAPNPWEDVEMLERPDEEQTNATVFEQSLYTNARNAPMVVATSTQSDFVLSICNEIAKDRSKKVPLELSLVVGSHDVLTADSLMYGEKKIHVSGGESGHDNNLVCFHELLFVAIIFIWLAIQILLLVGCLVVVKRYRTFAKNQTTKDYQSFDNLGFETVSTNRRVHWPDQSVDILHAN